MAGHSKWHNIKHRKAAVDRKRGKIWTKCAKAIIVAAKHGGADPASNLSLRYAIDEARYVNMPKDTIERAIKKGAGGAAGENYENVRYEGYGPGGVAFIVDALTDNRTRTAAEVRGAFTDWDGNLGSSGSVAYVFDMRGRIDVRAEGVAEDELIERALEAGAADVDAPPDPSEDGAVFTVLTDPIIFPKVKESLERAGYAVEAASLDMIPQNRVLVRGEIAKSNVELYEALEDLDDVQKVYANFDVEDEA